MSFMMRNRIPINWRSFFPTDQFGMRVTLHDAVIAFSTEGVLAIVTPYLATIYTHPSLGSSWPQRRSTKSWTSIICKSFRSQKAYVAVLLTLCFGAPTVDMCAALGKLNQSGQYFFRRSPSLTSPNRQVRGETERSSPVLAYPARFRAGAAFAQPCAPTPLFYTPGSSQPANRSDRTRSGL
ncbi:hypothetical protein FN846DRAFT_934614 [Sphaerosporella brunnea]|uniref:Uncharacterized protein n=1 Tax=Sphaerosporella brunnea TaxID=1250544 RepID=A0A5J5F5L8_9PEZI|nr:hypothetical protein FN846DRAFT_934614 [Sphaerosporella brunnea]